LYYQYNYTDNTDPDDIIEGEKLYIVDNKNIPGNSLGLRRLKLKEMGIRLKLLKSAVFLISDFIKLNKARCWWIDSNGQIFTYKKSTSTIIKSYKIERIIPSNTTGSILVLEDKTRFKTLFTIPESQKYAVVLEHKMNKILYGTSSTPVKQARRLI